MFGWAQLVNTGGVIQLLDGALAYQAGGIYVGTQTIIQVPEPTVTSFLVAFLLGIIWRKRQVSRLGSSRT